MINNKLNNNNNNNNFILNLNFYRVNKVDISFSIINHKDNRARFNINIQLWFNIIMLFNEIDLFNKIKSFFGCESVV